MLLTINDEHAREQLDFVAEQFEGDRARQEGKVRKQTLAERNFVGHRARLVEKEGERQLVTGDWR